MSQWDGKSKGTVLGYKIFIFFISKIGIGFAYFMLIFVAFYYLLFSRKGTNASYYYFRKRRNQSVFKSILSAYKNNYIFGQTIIDRVVITSGHGETFTYEFDGIENLNQIIENKTGGILISAHIGNFEVAEHFLNEIDEFSQINLVTTNREHQHIQEYLDQVSGKSDLKFIFIEEDLSHIFKINNALSNNEIVCFTGDRFFEGNKTLEENLLGEPAQFPAGPFLLSSRLNVPVLFVYVIKETKKHYHLYARKANYTQRDTPGLLKEYTQSIEWILAKYPHQWFNFFDFWNTQK